MSSFPFIKLVGLNVCSNRWSRHTIRAPVEDRKTPCTAEEILKPHPLPLEKTALTNLISQVYPGKWDAIPK